MGAVGGEKVPGQPSLGFSDVARDEFDATAKTFGTKGHDARFRNAGDNIPLTPAQLAWNYGAFWLGEVAPRVDRLAESKVGRVGADWQSERARFTRELVAIFGPHTAAGANDLAAFLKTMLTPAQAARFWGAVLRIGAAVDSVGLTPSAQDVAIQSAQDAGKDLLHFITTTVPDTAGSFLKSAALVGLGLLGAAIIIPPLIRR